MGRFILSPLAQSDFDTIWATSEANWGIDQAEVYTRLLWRHIETIATHPAIGQACPEIRAGYYRYPAGQHVLFYRFVDGGVDIVRVLHERMEPGRHIGTDTKE